MGRLSIFGALALVSACATADPLGGPVEEQDAAPQTFPDAAAPPDAGPEAVTLSQSTSTEIVELNSVSCSTQAAVHSDNSYYRVFDLADEGIETDFSISSITFGVQFARSGSGGAQPIELRVHTLEGSFVRGNLTSLMTVPMDLSDQEAGLVTVDLAVDVPGGAKLVLELFTPDGLDAGHRFRVGSNGDGQSAPSYISAPPPECNFQEPTDTVTAGFPNMHIVLSVDGTY
jgi:hypothetical protein